MNQRPTPEFVLEVNRVAKTDASVREYVSRSIEQELLKLQFGDENGDPRNECFDEIFDFLRANKPNASGVEVFRSAGPILPNESLPTSFPDVIGADRGRKYEANDLLSCLRS